MLGEPDDTFEPAIRARRLSSSGECCCCNGSYESWYVADILCDFCVVTTLCCIVDCLELKQSNVNPDSPNDVGDVLLPMSLDDQVLSFVILTF